MNYQPNIVIAFDGFNDIWTRMHFELRPGYPFNWSTYEKTLTSFYLIMNKAIRQLHEKNGLPFYSFDRVMDQRQDLFWDPVHTYDEAHRIYAEKISAILIENGYITD